MKRSKSWISFADILEPLEFDPPDRFIRSIIFGINATDEELLGSQALMGNMGLAFLGHKAIVEKVAPCL